MSLVAVSYEDDVALVELDRPDARNALSVELCDAIVEALAEADGSGARCIHLSGRGRVFCSGADFAAVSGEGGLDFLPAFERMLEAVARHRLPVVASIHGAALGGGLQLASACDLRVCAEDAKLGIPSARLGILVNFENIQRLVLLAGPAVAKEVLLTGRTFSAAEALERGLVNEVVAADALRDRGLEVAKEVAARAPLSVQGTKQAIQAVIDHLRLGASPEIDQLVAAAYRSEDLQEGIKAMTERREPRFTGR